LPELTGASGTNSPAWHWFWFMTTSMAFHWAKQPAAGTGVPLACTAPGVPP
jgi:hypothetical protein